MSAKCLLALFFALVLNPLLHAAETPKDAPSTPNSVPESQSDVPEITSQQIFQLLLAETALVNRQLDVAARAYGDLALSTRDLVVTKRAVELAVLTGEQEQELALTRQWQELEPDSREANLALLNLLAATDNIPEMLSPIQKLLTARPEILSENFLNLERILTHHSDRKAVLALMEQLAEPYPLLPEAHYAVAQAAVSAEQPEITRARARRARELKPEWAAPVLLEAQTILRANPERGANEVIALLSEHLRRYPNAPEIRMALARVLLKEKRYSEARIQFDRLLKDKPNDPETIYAVAVLAVQEKDYDMGRRLLEQLAVLPGADRNAALYFLGMLEEESGSPEAARSYYERVTGAPQYLFARARIAQQLAKAGQVDEALGVIRAAAAPTIPEKIQRIQIEALLLRDAGRHQEGFDLLSAALKEMPEESGLLYDAALAAEKAGRPEIMEQLLRKQISLEPENAQAYNALGYSLADRNQRLPEAYELIDKALRLAPEDPYIMDSMAWVLYRQGKLEEPLAILQRAYALRAEPEIAAHLGEVQWMMGRRKEAEALWKKAAAEAPDDEILRATIRKFMP